MAVGAIHMRIRNSILPVGIALISLAGAVPAHADYNYPSYNHYGSYGYHGFGAQEQPVISIDLDPRHLADSAFRVAAREGRVEDMMELVRQGADVDSVSDEGDTALMYAARNCSLEIASELVRLRANVNIRNKEGDTALMFASMESCLPVVKLLLKIPRINLLVRDRDGKTALDYAREGGELDYDGPENHITRLLLSRMPRVHGASKRGARKWEK